MNLHDPAARFPTLTGVLETRRYLYLTTLFGHSLPRIRKERPVSRVYGSSAASPS